MSIDIHYRPLAHRWFLGAAALGLAVALSGCGSNDAGPSASASEASPTTGSGGSPGATGAPTSSAAASAGEGDPTGGSPSATELPSPDLEQSAYEGEPRPLDEVYHRSCLEALAPGEELPETEVTGGDGNGELQVTPWSLRAGLALTEGWTYCPTAIGGGIAIPSTFAVEAEAEDGATTRLRISDASGRPVGGVERDVSGGAPEGARVVEVIDVADQPQSPDRGGETTYLRSLVVEAGSGTQLMVDLVSAPEGTDPETLQVWDLAVYGGSQRDVVYGTIPLDSAEDADRAAESELHEVLRSMVGSYTSPVQ